MNLNWEQPSRRLPPELLAEIHKCLPLADAINVLVNVPTRAIYQNNSPRMRRTIQRIKTTLREYIHPLALKNDENEVNNIAEQVENGNNDSKLYKSINIDEILPWSPKMDLLFRYGAWLLPTRNFFTNHQNSFLFGVPKDFVENLIDHLANSILVENALEIVQIQFGPGNELPQSLMQLLDRAKMCSAGRIGRIFLESIDLKIGENNVHIFDGELNGAGDELTMHLVNKKNPRKWFEIRIILHRGSRTYIRAFEFSAIQPTNEYMEDGCLLSEHYQILRRSSHIWSHQMDTILRRGAEFTHFRHFQIDKITECPPYYAEELICYMAYTKNPEYVLESMDIKIEYSAMSKMLHQIWNFCRSGIQKAGRLLKSGNENLFILAGTAHDPIKIVNENDETDTEDGNGTNNYFDRLEFTLANWHSNFGFLFDFDVLYPKQLKGKEEKTIEITIKRRKNELMKLDCVIGGDNKHGIKRKSAATAEVYNEIDAFYDDGRRGYKKAKYLFR